MKPSEIFEGENSSLRKTFDSIASSPQPEEWESRFIKEWNGVEGGASMPDFMMPFIKNEIRKAEERKCREIVESFQRMQERLPEFQDFLRSSHVAVIEAEIARKEKQIELWTDGINSVNSDYTAGYIMARKEDLNYLKEELENIKQWKNKN